jgi:integration host factor subunit alpha
MTLTKDRIMELMKTKSQISSPEAKVLVETVIESIKSKLEAGEEVKISGFGKWVVREKRSRTGRNPHTGEKIEIVARKVVTFHPSEKLRDAVNNSTLPQSKMSSHGAHEEMDEEISA